MTTPECPSCHAADGRPHTDYCPDRYRGDDVSNETTDNPVIPPEAVDAADQAFWSLYGAEESFVVITSQYAMRAALAAALPRLRPLFEADPMTRHDAAIIQAALDTIPVTCRYHGDDLEWGLRRDACCDTGKPALARRKAEAALKRSEETS
jgi:hypothetical protein